MRFFGRTLKRLFIILFLLLVAYQLWIFAWVLWWKWNPPRETNFMEIRLAELRQKNPQAQLKYQWVPYEKISSNLKRAVVASEDDKFMEHSGFDWDGIEYALKKNQRKGKKVAGGSTITQQLAKNLFLSPSRSYVRKLEEAVITVMLETLWDKHRILEVYLNVVEWGSGVFGAEAGARKHYGQSAATLGEYQAARMAVLLPSPRRFEKSLPNYVVEHAESVQERMRYSAIPR
ncbi:MAG: monofunctional biosynthetic peptidoglycan transglycosylase [Gammaproteobacteria bacterium]|nr:MAG: monofunctional biosynthetic peptidoglycan transglycosylase [Gammaproteobacteria bacterium]